jgi:phospholipid/cholesterol/gamma-HCH transport system substrate-binding protein
MAGAIWNRVVANRALAVGALVAVSGAVFLVAFTFFKRGGLSARDSYEITGFFDDVTGLSWKSRVQVAGIQIGEVTDIRLAGDRARLTLRVRNDVPLRADACLTKRFPSALLPDALLEASLGSPPAPLLRDLPAAQREVKCVREAASVAKLMESLSKIAGDIQVVSHDLAQTVGGTKGSIREVIENLSHVTRSVDELLDQNSAKVAGILDNTQAFTGEIREIAAKDKERYHAIARNVEEASARLNRVLASVESILGPNQPELSQSVQGARQALDKLNKTLDDVQKVTDKVAKGQGVAGKLLADDELGEKVGRSIEAVTDYVDRVSAMQLKVGIRSEWLLNQSGAKTYFGVTLLPKPDKYFIFELVSDPRGYNTVVTETATTENQTTGTSVTTVTARSINEQRLAISAEFGKRWGPVVLRIGIIESSGGLGADLLLLEDSLQLSMNLYQFTRPTVDVFPRTKLWVNWFPIRNVYITAGTDDVLNAWRAGRYPFGPKFSLGRDLFIGAGLSFTDQDLKMLLIGGGAGVVSGATAGSTAGTR